MRKSSKKVIAKNVSDLDFFELLVLVKKTGKKAAKKRDSAYEEIEYRIRSKIMIIVNQFYISGCSKDDLYQESLYALRYKAIPDYRKNRSADGSSYPFDKFAALCIRRHLSTLLKTSYQNKRRTLSTSISLDQDRSHSDNDNLMLSDILPQTEGNVLEDLQKKEFYRILFGQLYEKLSDLEKKVFSLYAQSNSYEEMAKILKKYNKSYNTKAVDNALTRIKIKAKQVYDHYQRIIDEKEKKNKSNQNK